MLYISSILLVFVIAMFAPLLHRLFGDHVGKLLAIVPLFLLVYFCTLFGPVLDAGSIQFSTVWAPVVGLGLEFYVDGLSLLFLTVISLIGTLVVLYAQGYLKGSPKLGRFYLALFIFMGAMLGVVSSDNLLLLFVFWELTSISSYLLIGYYHEKAASRTAALQALLVTGTGGIILLAGIILLGNAMGTFLISEMLRGDVALTETGYYVPALICILLGAFTKSAQFPFHFWLPNAMEAPAPVSSFLHSATMVKAGVFLLARLSPILAIDPLWFWIVTPVGAMTLITGTWLGLGQSDLKKILAYTTVAVLGVLTMLLGIGTDLAIKAMVAYLLAHAFYKGALFMASGAVDHESGCREVDLLGGLRRDMPITTVAAGLAALSMCGIPLFFGFLSKEYFYKAVIDMPTLGLAFTAVAVLGSALMFGLALTAGFGPYWGKYKETPKHAHDGPWTLWLGPLTLGALGAIFAFVPSGVSTVLIAPAAAAISGNAGIDGVIKYPAHIDAALILSIATVFLGVGAFFLAKRMRPQTKLYDGLAKVGPEKGYFGALDGMLGLAAWQTRVLQNGKLRNYVLTIAGFAMVLIVITAIPALSLIQVDRLTPVGVMEATICGLIIMATIFATFVRSRLAAIAGLGVVGLGIALLFLIYSAIDLAKTQILVETLAVILFILAFYRLPKFITFSSLKMKIRDVVISAVFGAIMGGLVLFGYSVNFFEPISSYFAQNSYTEAHGRNVVNVILVDFRALDTFGEIVVLAIAAVGIFSLLRLRIRTNDEKEGGQS